MSNNIINNDTIRREMLRMLDKIPDSEQKADAVTFIRIQMAFSDAEHQNLQANKERGNEIINSLSRSQSPIINEEQLHQRILDVFTMCAYLNYTSNDALLSKSIDDLLGLIKQLKGNNTPILLAFYRQTAILYNRLDRPQKSLDAERHLQAYIENLENNNIAKGRKFHKYDITRYQSYVRMVGNYKSLDSLDVERLFNEINNLAAVYPEIREDMERNGNVRIAYALFRHNLTQARDLIKRYIDVPENQNYRRHLTRDLILVARELGDKDTELEASKEYIKILQEYLDNRLTSGSNEIDLFERLMNMQERNDLLTGQAHERSRRTINIVLGCLIPIILLLAIVLICKIRSNERLRRHLKQTQEKEAETEKELEDTRNMIEKARKEVREANVQKTAFINDMSHEIRTPLESIADYSRLIADCLSDDSRSYLNRYVQLIDLNNELVQRVVSDVLDMAELENARMTVTKQPVALNDLCRLAVDTAQANLPTDIKVKVTFEPSKPDTFTISTDQRRVEQVLLNLLRNAIKFTPEGSVKLTYKVDIDSVSFYVEDTGIGIPEDKDEVIFNRFVKLDRNTQGAGLGLAVSQLIARLLNGSIKVDRTTPRTIGTVMVFTIPLK